jgi:hypothetical protein
MFWYLGIINKPPVPLGGEKLMQQQVTCAGLPNGQPSAPTPDAGDQMQAEAREKEEIEGQEQELLPTEQHELELDENN